MIAKTFVPISIESLMRGGKISATAPTVYRVHSDLNSLFLLTPFPGKWIWWHKGTSWPSMAVLAESIRQIQSDSDLYEKVLVGSCPFIVGYRLDGEDWVPFLYEELPQYV